MKTWNDEASHPFPMMYGRDGSLRLGRPPPVVDESSVLQMPRRRVPAGMYCLIAEHADKTTDILRAADTMRNQRKIENRKPETGVSAAYTVIEVLVSMAMIVIIAMIVSNIFNSGSESWDIGTRNAEINTSGRAALEFMAAELMQAVAGPIESEESHAADYMPFRVEADGGISFLALSQEPSGNERALRGVYLWKDGDAVKYARRTENLNCYKAIWNQGRPNAFNVIENVTNLYFYVYRTADDLKNDARSAGALDELPFCVDIFLELLSAADMTTARTLTAADRDRFIDNNARAYSTRVYFSNRLGYGGVF